MSKWLFDPDYTFGDNPAINQDSLELQYDPPTQIRTSSSQPGVFNASIVNLDQVGGVVKRSKYPKRKRKRVASSNDFSVKYE